MGFNRFERLERPKKGGWKKGDEGTQTPKDSFSVVWVKYDSGATKSYYSIDWRHSHSLVRDQAEGERRVVEWLSSPKANHVLMCRLYDVQTNDYKVLK